MSSAVRWIAPENLPRSSRVAGFRQPKRAGWKVVYRCYRPLVPPTPILTALPLFAQLSVVVLHMLSEQAPFGAWDHFGSALPASWDARSHVFYTAVGRPPSNKHTWLRRFGVWAILEGGVNTPTLVQSSISPQDTSGADVPDINIRLPEPSLANNMLVVATQMNGTLGTITDDAPGGTNTWVAGPNVTASGQLLDTHYVLAAKTGTRVVNIPFTNTAGHKAFQQAVIQEWYNVQTSGATDITTPANWHNSGTGTDWNAGAQTTLTNGDLIWHVGIQTAGTLPITFTKVTNLGDLSTVDNWTGGLAVTAFVQATAGSVTPSVTSSVNEGFAACAIAFKSAAAGTAPSAAFPHIQRIAVINTGAGATPTMAFQFPFEGNCVLFCINSVKSPSPTTDPQISSLSDTVNSYSEISGSPQTSSGGVVNRIFATTNASASLSRTITATYGAGAWGDTDVYQVYDIVNVDPNNPFVDTSGATGDQETQGNFDVVTLQNVENNNLCVYCSDQDRETITGLVSVTGANMRFDIPTWTGQDETGAGGAGSLWTKDVGGGHAITTQDLATLTFTQTESAGAGTGVGSFAAVAVALRVPPPPTALDTVYGHPFSNRTFQQPPMMGGLF